MGALAGMFFQMGKHSARIEALEKWREGIRKDMHEISDKLGEVVVELERLATLIEERTERRSATRDQQRSGD